MFKNITPAQVTLIKYAMMGAAAYWIYKKVTSIGAAAIEAAGEIASTSLNPMHQDNLANIAAEKIVGEKELADAGETFFDWIDRAAEAMGSETGINGIKGTNADARNNVLTNMRVSIMPVGKESMFQEQNRAAGNAATMKYGANANG